MGLRDLLQMGLGQLRGSLQQGLRGSLQMGVGGVCLLRRGCSWHVTRLHRTFSTNTLDHTYCLSHLKCYNTACVNHKFTLDRGIGGMRFITSMKYASWMCPLRHSSVLPGHVKHDCHIKHYCILHNANCRHLSNKSGLDRYDIGSLYAGLCNHDRGCLARAITLVESTNSEMKLKAQQLLHLILQRPNQGNTATSFRIGNYTS